MLVLVPALAWSATLEPVVEIAVVDPHPHADPVLGSGGRFAIGGAAHWRHSGVFAVVARGGVVAWSPLGASQASFAVPSSITHLGGIAFEFTPLRSSLGLFDEVPVGLGASFGAGGVRTEDWITPSATTVQVLPTAEVGLTGFVEAGNARLHCDLRMLRFVETQGDTWLTVERRTLLSIGLGWPLGGAG